MTKSFGFILFFSFLFFSLASQAHAGRIYFTVSNSSVAVGDNVTVTVHLDTQGQEINAVDLGILFPPFFEAKSISKSGSFLQLWVEEPSYGVGTAKFIGGTPGGIKTAGGIIGRVTLRARAVGDGSIALAPGASVLVNDGEGTQVSLQSGSVPISVVAKKAGEEKTPEKTPAKEEIEEKEDITPKKEKVETVTTKDKTKPARFNIGIGEDARVFNGQYFISFFTTDKQSGVDHYEVKEGKSAFTRARSPFLLDDQSMRSVIRVRAYDSAGNYRETVYPGFLKRIWWSLVNIFRKN